VQEKQKKKEFYLIFFFVSSVVPRGSQWAALAVKIVDCLGAERWRGEHMIKCAEILFCFL
jgi:hypothetical protein